MADRRPKAGRDGERPVRDRRDGARGHRRAERPRNAARLPQHLPPSRGPGRPRLRQAADAAMPLSRLDLRARRSASPRTGDGRDRRLSRRGLPPDAGAGGRVGTARVREPRPQGAAARPLPRGHSGTCREVPRRRDALRDEKVVDGRLQLEGLRRQLPRGIPHPGGASGAAAGDRLRPVPGGTAPLLLAAARPAAAGAGRTRRRAVASTCPNPRASRRSTTGYSRT